MLARCPLCGMPSPLALQTRDYNRRLSAETFCYHRCSACELIFLSPVPADLGVYYPDEYYEVPSSRTELTFRAEVERWKLDLVQRFVRRGRLLEIGPAYGLFAYLAKQAGFEVETIERDARCCRFLEEVAEVKAINSGDVCSVLQTIEPCTVITLWQVIEHLPDPWEVLVAASEQLVPGGILVVATPNPDAFQFKILRRFWAHVDAPRHLELIPVSLLTRQLQPFHLAPVLLTTTDRGSLGWNSFGWAVSLRNFFGTQSLRSTAYFAGRLLTKALIPVERSGWYGSAYTAILQKSL